MHRLDHESSFAAASRRTWQWMTAERQVILRSKGHMRYVSVSRARQIGLACLALAAAGWIGFSSASYFQFQIRLLSKEAVIAKTEQAYRDLLADMQDSRSRFLEITGILENNHTHLVGLLNKNKTLRGDLKSLKNKLRRHEDIKRELTSLEGKVQEAEDRNSKLVGRLDTKNSELTAAITANTVASDKGEKMNARVAGLEKRLDQVRGSQKALINRITATTVGDIRRLSRLIAQTGLNSQALIAANRSSKRGQGGPFIPVRGAGDGSKVGQAISVLYSHIDRWESLQRVVRRLPLATPVDSYYIASKFGKRRDPFNKRWGVHRGLDLAGRSGQSVRAVARGKVVRARWKGRYGRMIEIDHGNGIHTLYGHLLKIKVKRGQTVKYRQLIGRMGSSGRSTGPHLHYEILVNGKQVDPIKFLNAGKNVLKG